MKLADIKITTNALQHDTDLTYNGWIHPQINPDSLLLMIIGNWDLTQAAKYSVIVEADTPAGPYTTDVQPIEEFTLTDTMEFTEEARRRVQDSLESQDEEEEEIFED